jgi:hypothetical protein
VSFAECKWGFAECPMHSAKNAYPVVSVNCKHGCLDRLEADVHYSYVRASKRTIQIDWKHLRKQASRRALFRSIGVAEPHNVDDGAEEARYGAL